MGQMLLFACSWDNCTQHQHPLGSGGRNGCTLVPSSNMHHSLKNEKYISELSFTMNESNNLFFQNFTSIDFNEIICNRIYINDQIALSLVEISTSKNIA